MNIFQIFIILTATFMQVISVKGQQGSCNENTFNGTEGVITTPGYPYNLSFNKSCSCHIDVGDGKIELTFKNVSLPNGSIVVVQSLFFKVGVHPLQNRVVYVPRGKAIVFVSSLTNPTGAYGGMKLMYRRISNDVCKFDYRANAFDNSIKSPGYPNSAIVNSTCVYNIHVFDAGNVVHIGFKDFSFGPNDVLTIYDGANNSVILGPLTGPQDSIRTEPTNSVSVKIVIVTTVTSSVKQRYSIYSREVPKGTCLEEYYESPGSERRVSSVAKHCSYIIRPGNVGSRVVMWLDSINIPANNFVTVDLMAVSGRLIRQYRLASNFSGVSRVYDGLNRGNWFEIEKSANASFDLKFKTYTRDECPFYLISERFESPESSPGYPDPFPSNSSCEYYIRSRDQSEVVYLRFPEESLSSGDTITVYDGSDDSVIARYDGTGRKELSVTANSPSIRVVFTFGEAKHGRRYWFYHKIIPPDSCIVDYQSKIGQLFSSFNRSCEYNIHLANSQFEIKLDNLVIPANSYIKLVQKRAYLVDRPFTTLDSSDSGKTKYFRSRKYYNVISISADANVSFDVSLQHFIEDRTIYVRGSNGTLLSPYYPNSYLIQQFEPVTLTFYIEVPLGHVVLNLTEIKLASSTHYGDYIDVYDGNTTSSELRWRFDSRLHPTNQRTVLLASSNHLTVRFSSHSESNEKKVYRFKAIYTSQIDVNYCKPIRWAHSHAERNLTFPGRKTKFICDEGYARKDKFLNYVTRTCNFDGTDWQGGETLACLKNCPRIDDRLKVNSSLSWIYSSLFLVDGTYVTFFCNYYNEDLAGPKQITCTSHGNYSAVPPVCKKRPKRDPDEHDGSSNGWKYGVGFGGAAFMIGIVLTVLRVCFGCFACCASPSASSIPMSEVKYSST